MIKFYKEFEQQTIVDKYVTVGRGSNAECINLCRIGFDIETTNNPATETAFMYIWQLAVNDVAYYGRTWEQFFEMLEMIRNKLSGVIIILIHNMGFEMSFLLPRLWRSGMLSRCFAKAEREPLEVALENGIIFRDTMAITNMSLAALAKNYCHTQKLKGDLDYSILRNSFTPLTEKEMCYCENDVLILSEYAAYLHSEYTEKGAKIPFTSTGIVRRMVKKAIPGKEYRSVQKKVAKLYPKTDTQYDYTMQWLFRGAFCHAQTAICGDILEDVTSHDLKSAYPAEMCHRLYPMTPFKAIPAEAALDCISMGMAVIMLVEFENITATGAHVLESSHKILSSVNPEYENGRLYHADSVTVLICDVDYKIYRLMYKWDSMNILGAKSAVKKPLPDYLLKPLFEVYEQKEKIGKLTKADPDNNSLRQAYMSIKGKLNSFYGMTVARLNLTVADFKNGKWVTEQNSFYEDEVDKSVLSPYWGIYVTAYTRLTICEAIVAIGDGAFYSDTDSIKHIGGDDYFVDFNRKMENINRKMCDKYGLDFEVFRKLGTFDNEGTYDRFKTLGAKRYLVEKDGKVESTVAGLPKGIMREFAEKHGNDSAFEFFKPEMTFKISGKNAHKYSDECAADICGELMHEYGCCYIFSVPFQMKIEDSFLLAITKRKRLNEHDK